MMDPPSESPRAAELAEHYAICDASLREKDRDLWLASLFAPAGERRRLHALWAFVLEVEEARFRVTQPLLGEMRLQWWMDAIAAEEGDGVHAHPVADALLDTIAARALSRDDLLDFLEAHIADFYDDPVERLDDLLSYCRRTAARPLLWCAKCHGFDADAAAAGAIEDAGAALGLTRLLWLLPSAGAQFLPLELLSRHGVPREDAVARRDSPQMRAALAELRALARARFAAAREAQRRIPDAARVALLPVATVPLYLDRMDARDYRPFAPQSAPQPWRRQWRLWRAAHRGL
jgi:15-cis-phytoene synthase